MTYDFAGRIQEYTLADDATIEFEPVMVQGLVDTRQEGSSGNPVDLFSLDDAVGTFTDPLSLLMYQTQFSNLA